MRDVEFLLLLPLDSLNFVTNPKLFLKNNKILKAVVDTKASIAKLDLKYS